MTDTVAKAEVKQPEPWLRGTLTDVPAVIRAVVHALELAREDAERWCGGLTGVEVNARPAGLPSIALSVAAHHRKRGPAADLCRGTRTEPGANGGAAAKRSGAMAHVLLREFGKAMEAASQRVLRSLERIWSRSDSWAAGGCRLLSVGCWCTLPNTRSGTSDRW